MIKLFPKSQITEKHDKTTIFPTTTSKVPHVKDISINDI